MADLADPNIQNPAPLHENYSKVVWALAGPAVALNSLQVVNTLLDRFFVGHLPASSLTAYGGSMNVMFLMFSLAMALATGATAIVARAFGAGNKSEFRRGAQEALGLAVFGGIFISLLTVLVSAYVAHLVLPAEDLQAKAIMVRFLAAYAAGLPAIFVIQVLAGSLRGIGDTRSPMTISGLQILLHMFLNFVLVPRLGLVGAGCALSSSAWASAIVYVWYVSRTPLGSLSLWRIPKKDWTMRILRVAVPAATMATLRVFSLTAFTIVLKYIPNASEAIAAMSVGFAIESIMFMPAFGLSIAAGALVGQSLGMKKPERAERLAWVAGHHGALVTLALIVPIYYAAPSIAAMMLDGKVGIIGEASTLIRYLCVTELLFAYSMVMIGAMQGAGDTVRPMWISIVSLWFMRVPLAVVFALPKGFALAGVVSVPFFLGLGSKGAWLSMSLTQAVQGVLSLIAFKQGAWKTKKV